MGTSTIYKRMNDLGLFFDDMTKKDLKELNKLSPYRNDSYYRGWNAPFELHNGNVYVLVFWKGRLMKLEDAPHQLNRKYWDKHRGKTHNLYEWTLLKRLISNEVDYLDKRFKKELKKKKITQSHKQD